MSKDRFDPDSYDTDTLDGARQFVALLKEAFQACQNGYWNSDEMDLFAVLITHNKANFRDAKDEFCTTKHHDSWRVSEVIASNTSTDNANASTTNVSNEPRTGASTDIAGFAASKLPSAFETSDQPTSSQSG